MKAVSVWCAVWLWSRVCVGLFVPAGRYSWESALLVREAARPDRAAGGALRGDLSVRPLQEPYHKVLQFTLESIKFQRKKKNVNNDFVGVDSIWDQYGPLQWWAEWSDGVVTKLVVDPALPIYVHNLQRSLTSLLQFRAEDGWHNETDVSGDCRVQYETLAPHVFRKIKRRCVWQGDESGSEDGGETRGVVRRVTRVETGSGGAVNKVRAEEEGRWRDVSHRAWGVLQRTGDSQGAALTPPLTHTRTTLALQPDPEWDEPHVLYENTPETVEEVLKQYGREELAEVVGEGGDLASLRRWERLVGAPRGGEDAMKAGGVQGEAAAAAIAARERIWEEALLQPELHKAVLQAGLSHIDGAAAGPLVGREGPEWLVAGAARAASAVGEGLEQKALRKLERCVGDGRERCVVPWLGLLGPGALLDLIERADVPLLAAQALRRMALTQQHLVLGEHMQRLHRIILIPRHPYTVEVQAEVLSALYEVAEAKKEALGLKAAPILTADIWGALRARGEYELARYLLSRGGTGGEGDWWAASGRSGGAQAVVDEFEGWRGTVSQEHVLRHGALRTAAVRVELRGPGGVYPALTVRAWARGMDSLVGGDEAGEEQTEEPAAGVAWEAMGGPREEVELFRGMGGLAAAAWGASGEPAVLLRRGYWAGRAARVASMTGVCVDGAVGVAGRAAGDGAAAVSLWSRSGTVTAALRGALGLRARVAVRAPWLAVSAVCHVALAPSLTVDSAIDFYEDISLCIKADLGPYNITSECEVVGAGARLVRRGHTARGGRSLRLDPALTAQCPPLW